MTHEGRPDVGRLGVWTDQFDGQPLSAVKDAAAEIEELGYSTLWLSEVTGREALTQATLLLGATSRLVVATGVATIYGRDAVTMAQAERTLAEAFPGRFVLGLGNSHPYLVEQIRGHSFGPRVATMRGYLDAMDAAPFGPTVPGASANRVLGVVGRQMLGLAAQRAWGALPFGMPVAHTARAREILGPEPLLAVGQPVVLESDPDLARQTAHAHVAASLPNRDRALAELGYGEDVSAGGSDRLADAMIASGGLEAVTRRVAEQFKAGADHVCLYVLVPEGRPRIPLEGWRELAAALR
ncbi:TIGR03620 family F420-dependent LLM class oxidoreductase [Streptomyces sp. 3MP-14]|uniref:TIGR03620 family F420-dependent LLM class oxidoreductase n=1 Tax=Streptomyces mimosae TaxID=2586635 RepID=A0A5N6ALT9_9ACTN|nr:MULTISPECIES: TIGR03620 family F420-dependent LLM class oxidoreductase [Streptomyces]KAB8169631.1 TIGR03620 family F420-dependent LLM class oxidoreductase [Streptomyces mimosae]KAB8178379.1 TIGR03620 family F420-dependent LLM class oxidoreductase [Streptomyces sp. 3MP-14]